MDYQVQSNQLTQLIEDLIQRRLALLTNGPYEEVVEIANEIAILLRRRRNLMEEVD